jgi:hypothetical protein
VRLPPESLSRDVEFLPKSTMLTRSAGCKASAADLGAGPDGSIPSSERAVERERVSYPREIQCRHRPALDGVSQPLGRLTVSARAASDPARQARIPVNVFAARPGASTDDFQKREKAMIARHEHIGRLGHGAGQDPDVVRMPHRHVGRLSGPPHIVLGS